MRKLLFILLLFSFSLAEGQGRKYYSLLMRNTGVITLWDGQETNTYGFATKLAQRDILPGPIITVNEGDSVIVDVRNISQGAPHTIHWHGLDVDQQNDGTPATSFVIHHMEWKTYRFKATHAGTYIYHCHLGDVVHVQMGMYGLVIVLPADSSKRAWTAGPVYDKTYHWLTSELDKKWHDTIPNTEYVDTVLGHESFPIPKYKPTYFMVNGKSKQQIKLDSTAVVKGVAGDNIYLRIANIGYYQNQIIFPAKMKAKIIDSDGRPLPTAFYADTFWVSPGERFGVMFENVLEMTDSIEIKYINMNTHAAEGSEWMIVDIDKQTFVEQPKLTYSSVFPNPASASWNLSYPSIISYTIFDITGRQLVHEYFSTTTNNITIPADQFSQGIYLLRVSVLNTTFAQKIIKQ